MPRVEFTSHLRRHLEVRDVETEGATVREVLDSVFADQPKLRGYVLDDRGALRQHVVVFVGGDQIRDRTDLSDPVPPESTVHVLQALSGG